MTVEQDDRTDGEPVDEAFAALLERMEQVPVRKTAAIQVLRLIDDPDASARAVGMAASADPVLAGKVMRMANSAYYGLSGRVGNVPTAVSVLGFLTVRSLAAAAAAQLAEPDAGASLPVGFWGAATTTATAASLIAARCGARRDDAFCAGILHDLGSALLRGHDPVGHEALVTAELAGGRSPWVSERAGYGVDHAEAAGRVLATWNFPAELCDAISAHHSLERPGSNLARALRGGRALAARMPRAVVHDPSELTPEALAVGRVQPDEVPALLLQVQEHSRSLTAALVG